jgi:hypothetical protein
MQTICENYVVPLHYVSMRDIPAFCPVVPFVPIQTTDVVRAVTAPQPQNRSEIQWSRP